MRVNAELHAAIVEELRRLPEADVVDFRRQLEAARLSPIKYTEPFYDKSISGYVLRRFSFGSGVERIAICTYDGDTLRVLKCRLLQPRRRRTPKG
jgi:hypothetical protein